MKGRQANLALVAFVSVLVLVLLFSGCGGGGTLTTASGWQWPRTLIITSGGGSGLAKYVSWTTMMEKDTGMSIRVVPEENSIQRFMSVQYGKAFLVKGGKRELGNVIEATEGHAVRDGGPWQMRVVWIHAISNSGIFVRGDSPIKTIYDIKPGIRWAVWSMQPTVLKVPKAIADWIQLPHDQIVWVNAGSYDGCARAVAEGRADIMFGFPTSPAIYEAAAAPGGIRFLDLNSDKDPEGAARFRANDPAYAFGPILSGVPEARGVWGTSGATLEVTLDKSDPELVYNFAKWLDTNYERYKDAFDTNEHMSIDALMNALERSMIPVHDGLIKYLKEKNLWTPAHDKRQATNIAAVTAWCNAYPEAIKLADSKGIKIDPTNEAWMNFWQDYQKEKHLPKIGLHQSLTVDYVDNY
jgi:TRAP transporter TAXI family solute receptor